jgi:hypothetical protein
MKIKSENKGKKKKYKREDDTGFPLYKKDFNATIGQRRSI